MRSLVLFIAILLIFVSQHVESRSNFDLKESVIVPPNNDLRGISDVWDSIRNTVEKAWCSIKDIAEKTKDKIKKWMKTAKEQVQEITLKFEDRINNIREKSKKILEDFLSSAAGQLVKECFQKESEVVEELLKNVRDHVSLCMSAGMINVSREDEHLLTVELNKTAFVNEIENNINKCMKEHDADDCSHKVRRDIFYIMENMEDEVLTRSMESRSIASDLIDTVMSCSIEGLFDASNVIAAESLQIIACVIKG